MKKVNIGEKYYYNNGQVEILKIETEEFVLVKGIKDIHVEVNGSDFCQACMIGGVSGVPMTHKCSDVDDIIEEVMSDLSEEDIFWVNTKHLQDKPFEYKRWEKITEENNKLLKEVAENQRDNLYYKECLKELELQKTELSKSISDEKLKLDEIINNLSNAEQKKIVLDDIPEIKISNSNLKISTSTILDFIKDSKMLASLEAGGVDNWEWYSESLPDCEDVDEYFANEALQELSNYTINQ